MHRVHQMRVLIAGSMMFAAKSRLWYQGSDIKILSLRPVSYHVCDPVANRKNEVILTSHTYLNLSAIATCDWIEHDGINS